MRLVAYDAIEAVRIELLQAFAVLPAQSWHRRDDMRVEALGSALCHLYAYHQSGVPVMKFVRRLRCQFFTVYEHHHPALKSVVLTQCGEQDRLPKSRRHHA